MKLTELNPQWYKVVDETHFNSVDNIEEADGICFLCPKCFMAEPKGEYGCHSVICWRPRVSQNIHPVPGRWEFLGTSFEDLTLQAGSSSVLLTSGCMAHFFITNGEILNT